MNLEQSLNDRISKRLQETKNPCKTYATYEAADKAISKVCEQYRQHAGTNKTANWVVFYVPEMDRWTAAVDVNEYIRRPDCQGHYLPFVAAKGFLCY